MKISSIDRMMLILWFRYVFIVVSCGLKSIFCTVLFANGSIASVSYQLSEKYIFEPRHEKTGILPMRPKAQIS